jgi:riboflavin kinase/FMN adenylyltransferase
LKMIHLYYPLQWPIRDFPEGNKQVIAIGDFDGVHKGHRHVIGQAVEIGKRESIPVAIMTFNPHPREVLGQLKYSRYLAPIHDKMQLFASQGVDYTYIVTFDQAFAQISPEKFVNQMLEPMNIHTVVVGFDFTFGHKGKGTADSLKKLAEGKMNVEVVNPYHMDGEKVSSTLIREHLHLGELSRMKDYLDRYYTIRGMVIKGDQRGRQLGFPTANLEVTAPYVIPRNGVYAVLANVDGARYEAVMNIGTRPTFLKDALHPNLEVHLLDFEGDLYGQMVQVEFVHFLRAEEQFSSVDALVKQIHKDIAEARHLLSQK